MEAWAIGTLEKTPSKHVAQSLLKLRTSRTAKLKGSYAVSLIDLAFYCEMKNFLDHRHCRSLMNLWWRGGISDHSPWQLRPNFSWATLATRAFLPFLPARLFSQLFQGGAEDTDQMDHMRGSEHEVQ